MVPAERFLKVARELGYRLVSGVPCSYLTPLIDCAIGSADQRYVGAANEGDAVAVAAGAELAGWRALAMFQNSGLGNAVNPLTSLTHTFRVPVLVIVTWRGEPGGAPDEPQHELMGAVTTRMLDLMEVPWAPFPTEARDVERALAAASRSMEERRRPFALVMSKGSVEAGDGGSAPAPPRARTAAAAGEPLEPRATRGAVLRAVRAATTPQDVVVATTGYTGRELYAAGDAPNQFYVVGSMGCATSVALGIALARPNRRVVVLDGDGAALMRLGAFATLGHERPENLVHVLLDNGRHESTGGQTTVSRTTDLAAVAAACGYPRVERAADPEDLRARLAERSGGLRFLHVPTLPGVPGGLPRPRITPAEVAERLRRDLASR